MSSKNYQLLKERFVVRVVEDNCHLKHTLKLNIVTVLHPKKISTKETLNNVLK